MFYLFLFLFYFVLVLLIQKNIWPQNLKYFFLFIFYFFYFLKSAIEWTSKIWNIFLYFFFSFFYFLLFEFSVQSLSYLILFTIHLKIFSQNFEIFIIIIFYLFLFFLFFLNPKLKKKWAEFPLEGADPSCWSQKKMQQIFTQINCLWVLHTSC